MSSLGKIALVASANKRKKISIKLPIINSIHAHGGKCMRNTRHHIKRSMHQILVENNAIKIFPSPLMIIFNDQCMHIDEYYLSLEEG